ncbi:MAG TPA: Ig-like domain-containing protein, partial [bacterium]|nr:Ig-like domain-containing protein [bacterium]
MLSLDRLSFAGRCRMALGCWIWFTFLHTPPVWPDITGDPLFSDGFEVNDPGFPAWDEDSGNLQVAGPPAPMTGNYSMAAVITDPNPRYVRDILSTNESRYRARFLFDVNSLAMADGDQHVLLRGIDGSGNAWAVQLRFSSGGYQVQLAVFDDASISVETPWFPITDDRHAVEIEWAAATGAGTNNGFGIFWIDGSAKFLIRGIDNDTRRTASVYLGPSQGLDAGTSGTLYFDAFESARPPARDALLAEKSVRLEDDLNGNQAADPGDSVTYTDTLVNVGPADLFSLQLLDTLDANTAQVPGTVKTTPLAFNDSYQSLGNVGIDVPAANGLLANDADLENQLLAGPPPLNTGLTVTAFDALSAQGGQVMVSPNGGFTYIPPAGYEGDDTFSYTIQDADGNQDRGVVTIQVAEVIWFIDNTAGSAGDGRLGSPFNSLAGFVSNAADERGDVNVGGAG